MQASAFHLEHRATVELSLFFNWGTYTTYHPIAKCLGRADLLIGFLGIYFSSWCLKPARDFSLRCSKGVGNSTLHLVGLAPAKGQQHYKSSKYLYARQHIVRWNKSKASQEGWNDTWLCREAGLLNHLQKARKCLVSKMAYYSTDIDSDPLCLNLRNMGIV